MPYGAPVTTPTPGAFKRQQQEGLTYLAGGAIAALASGGVLPNGFLRLMGVAGGMGLAFWGWKNVVESVVKERVADQIKMGEVVASCVAQYALTGVQRR